LQVKFLSEDLKIGIMAVDGWLSFDKLEELTSFYLNFERVEGFHMQGT